VIRRPPLRISAAGGALAACLFAGAAFAVPAGATSTGRPPAVTPACSFFSRSDLEAVAGATVSDGALNLNKRHVSGCAYAAPDPQQGPNVGILVTNRARAQDLFDKKVLESAFGIVERIPDVGRRAYFGIREKSGGAIDSLLLARDGAYGVQVAVTGSLDRQRVLDIAQQVASTVLQQLAVSP
jgi:hypothetical protein